jgi:hypothetical protein
VTIALLKYTHNKSAQIQFKVEKEEEFLVKIFDFVLGKARALIR